MTTLNPARDLMVAGPDAMAPEPQSPVMTKLTGLMGVSSGNERSTRR